MAADHRGEEVNQIFYSTISSSHCNEIDRLLPDQLAVFDGQQHTPPSEE